MSSFLFTPGAEGFEREVSRRVARDPSQMQTDFSDVYSAMFESAALEEVSYGPDVRRNQYMMASMEKLADHDPAFDPSQWTGDVPGLGVSGEDSYQPPPGYSSAVDFFKTNTDRVRELAEQYPDLGIETWDEIEDRVKKEAAALREKAAIAAANAPGGQALAGQFLGMGAAIMTHDPLVIGTLPIGPQARGATVVGRILSGMGREAVTMAGIEAVAIQPQIYLQKRRIDSPYTVEDAVIAVLGVAGGSAMFRGLLQGGGEGLRAIRGTGEHKQFVNGLRDQAQRLRDDGDDASADLIDNYADVIDSTPRQDDGSAPTPREEQRHVANMDQAYEDLGEGRITDAEIPTDGDSSAILDELDRKTVMIDPLAVRVDAQTFQFKSDTDASGVSARLKDVTKWDSDLASIALVFEDRAGTRFIVDGHQRLALAKRLLTEGGDPNEIKLRAQIFKESDGVTPQFVRRKAAIKNIVEGTGTPMDAAKVLRDLGEEGLAKYPNVPAQSALVRDAVGLSKLDDETFTYVANVLKPEEQKFAAIVGELIEAGPEQLAAIRALVEAEPGNLMQARLIVEQIRAAGFETTETMDLFGGQTISETLFKERARVLDNALRTLKRDKATFRTLVEREAEISGAGNVLERQSNIERLSDDEKAIQTLGRLANTAGPISDALNDAARRLKDGARLYDVSRSFLSAYRRAADEGYLGRNISGTTGREIPGKSTPADRQEVDRATKEYVSDTRALLPDDPEIDELAAAEARQVADILEQNPDLEIPVEIRVDADGNQITETRKASEVYDDLVEEDTRTTDMFTCMTGGGRG